MLDASQRPRGLFLRLVPRCGPRFGRTLPSLGLLNSSAAQTVRILNAPKATTTSAVRGHDFFQGGHTTLLAERPRAGC
jgi:hypothetical protein